MELALKTYMTLMAGWLQRSLRLYDHACKTRPIVTASITSGALMGGGDVLCQTLQGKGVPEEGYDGKRVIQMASWGVVIYGTIAHGWYSGIEKVIRCNGARGTVAKVAADQFVLTPPLTIAFFSWQHYFAGMDLRKALVLGVDRFPPTFKVDLCVWPWVHLVTFSIMPVAFRVLWVNGANLLWNCFLSFMAYAGTPSLPQP